MTTYAITQSEYSRKMAQALGDRLENWRHQIQGERATNPIYAEALVKKYEQIVRDISSIKDLKTSSIMKSRLKEVINDLQATLTIIKKTAPGKGARKKEIEQYRARRDEIKVEISYAQQLYEHVSELTKFYHTTNQDKTEEYKKALHKAYNLITIWENHGRIMLKPAETKEIQEIRKLLER